MTKADAPAGRRIHRLFALCAACLAAAALLLPGCFPDGSVEPFPEPEGMGESGMVIRRAPAGPVIVTYASYPLRDGAPADGVRAAVMRAIGNANCSVASFYWSERARALKWIRDELDQRRRSGLPPRLILAGHGLGATEASETAREIIFNDRDVEIVLLLTVDAVKTGKIGSAAAVTGNALTHRIPGVKHSFTAYEAAPEPDARQLWAHVNYYQSRSVYYHGTAMPYAENHLIDDWTGLLNHGNADDFAMTFLVSDLRHALRAAAQPGRTAVPGGAGR